MARSIADLRRDYQRATLDEHDVAPDPVTQFLEWFREARSAEATEPNAMTLATVDAAGRPDARVVLLKAVDGRGFVFFTDYRSRKADDLEARPHAALVFYWPELERQVRVTGRVTRVAVAEAEEYYKSRPLPSRIGAWASHQSQVLPDRATLERAVEAMTARFAGGEPPLPPHWGGYRVEPESVEFWQGRASRLHDRIRYRRDADRWVVERLSP